MKQQRPLMLTPYLLLEKNARLFLTSLRAVAGFLIIMLLPGCLKDKTTHTYSIYTPVYKTTAEVRANIKSNTSREFTNPGKLFIKGNYIFLNDVDKGIHVIDNSNPASPKNISFIDIPGNMDLAVKGNILYADLYTDLVAIDITDPLHIQLKKIIDNAFPQRLYTNGFVSDRSKIIVDWVKKDTTVREDYSGRLLYSSCASCMMVPDAMAFSSATKAAAPFGMGGSMARFSIVANSLYTVSESMLDVYSITTPENPVSVNKISMGWGIETIFPFKDKLFIGSNNGVFIYDITNQSSPSRVGQFSHVTACDPVIADEKYAFVTLSSGVRCSNASNQLDVLDISSLTSPTMVKSYPMTNPHGLSKDGNSLFICDGAAGLKVYDATDVKDLKLKSNIKGSDTYDVIAYNNVAIVVAKDGLFQYDYSNIDNIKLLSRIGWAN